MDPLTSNSTDEAISAGQSSDARGVAGTATQTIVLPVIREEWQLDKEIQETGTVRVHRQVQDREELIGDSLTSETVEIERIAMNQIVDSPPEVRTEDGVTVISVVKEFAIVTKQLRIVEEIRVSRRKSEIPIQQVITLRSQEITVERLPAGHTAHTDDLPHETIQFQETLEQAVVTKQARVVEEVSVTKEVSERTETIRETLRHTELAVEDMEAEQLDKASTSGR